MPRTVPRDVQRKLRDLEDKLRTLRVAIAPVVEMFRFEFRNEDDFADRRPDHASWNMDVRFGHVRQLLHVAGWLDKEIGGPIENCPDCTTWDSWGCTLCKLLRDRKED